jgi:chromosome segregation ATPase
MSDIVKELRLPASIDQADTQRRLAADEIERLRSSFAAADEALAPCSSALEDCDQENQRLREQVEALKIYNGIEIERLRAEAVDKDLYIKKEAENVAQLSAEIERLRGLLRDAQNDDISDSLWGRIEEALGRVPKPD